MWIPYNRIDRLFAGARRIDIAVPLGENGGGLGRRSLRPALDGHLGSKMNRMQLGSAVKWLLVLTLALPVVALVLAWTGGLLRAMGDAAGAMAVGYVVTVCQVVWALNFVGLVILLALLVVNGERPSESSFETPEVDEELE